jgi:hypothetical protein
LDFGIETSAISINTSTSLMQIEDQHLIWWQAADPAFVSLVPRFEKTAEWQDAVKDPKFAIWGKKPDLVSRVQGGIAYNIVRKLRDAPVREQIASGDPFWLSLALNLVGCRARWHQSDRIRLSVMRSLRRRLMEASVPSRDREEIRAALEAALLNMVRKGVGEEFKGLANLAKAVATPTLRTGLSRLSKDATQVRSVRINAQRMLDRIEGKSYRRYRDSL